MKNRWLRKFLNVYWLRPENALWRSVNCVAMEDLEFHEPSLDLSCGDGIFSFLQADGNFDLSFDIFTAVKDLDRFFEDVDIYDATSQDYTPPITSYPSYKITVGTDWKQNLLDKAASLDFYKELRLHDNNDPLPFKDDTFRTIFSNSVYWVENLTQLLSEVARVLHPEGRAILVLKTDSIREYTLDHFESALGPDWLSMIDRGRKSHYPRLFNDEGWTKLLNDAGLQVISKRPQITWLHAHIWDIGLRSISPVLIEMANALPPQKRREVKRKWIEVWEKLLLPFCSSEQDLDIKRPPAEIIYVLRKYQP